MDWTDRHCRFFHRLITRRTWPYTEVVITGALLHGDLPRHLGFNPEEHPLALQVGGSEPVRPAASGRRDQDSECPVRVDRWPTRTAVDRPPISRN